MPAETAMDAVSLPSVAWGNPFSKGMVRRCPRVTRMMGPGVYPLYYQILVTI